MSRSSDRGWAEPLAALVALTALGAGLTVYAGVLQEADTAGIDGRPAADSLDRVHEVSTVDGATNPANLAIPADVATKHRAVRVRLSTRNHEWTAGDPRPADAGAPTHTDRRSVPVRTAPGENDPGTLRVEVWT